MSEIAFKFEDFFKDVAQGLHATQVDLDQRSEAYNRARPHQPPVQFRVPAVRARMALDLKHEKKDEFRLVCIGASELRTRRLSQEIEFTVETAPQPPAAGPPSLPGPSSGAFDPVLPRGDDAWEEQLKEAIKAAKTSSGSQTHASKIGGLDQVRQVIRLGPGMAILEKPDESTYAVCWQPANPAQVAVSAIKHV